MSYSPIYITAEDRARVEWLMLFYDLFTEEEQKRIRRLYYEVSQGLVVSADQIPSNVVTTHSRIKLEEIKGDTEVALYLVFPDEMKQGFGRVSILTAIGAALFGRRVGDIVECQTATGVRRFAITSTKHFNRDSV